MENLVHEEIFVSKAIQLIKENSCDEEMMKETEEGLQNLMKMFKKIANNKHLIMRMQLLLNIFRMRISMIQQNKLDLQDEEEIVDHLNDASGNLHEWICAIEYDVRRVFEKIGKAPNYDYNKEISDLLNETQFSYKLVLFHIHELNSSMTVHTDTDKLYYSFKTIRGKTFDCLGNLLRILMTQPLEPIKPISNETHQQIMQIDFRSFQSKLDFQTSNWNNNLKALLNNCTKICHERVEKETEADVSFADSFSLSVRIDKINMRLDNLIQCMEKNIHFNYEEELSLINKALSNLEAEPLDPDNELRNQVSELKTKLTELQTQIAARSSYDHESVNKIRGRNLSFSPLYYDPGILISETIKSLFEEFKMFWIDTSRIEDDFLDAVLSANEFDSFEKDQRNLTDHEKLNQYHELLWSFNNLIGMMKLYISNDHFKIDEYNDNVEQQILVIKKTMMVIIATMSMLERFSNMIYKKTSNEGQLIISELKDETHSLFNCVIRKITCSIEYQKRCSLFLDQVVPLIDLMKKQLENLSHHNVWEETNCKILLHRSSWLINLWQHYGEQVQCPQLTERFNTLVQLINSINKLQLKYIITNHFIKEKNKDYWFEILRDWQNRTEPHLLSQSKLSKPKNSSEKWKSFHDKMYLVCEFDQIDANIDHYEVKFEIDFIEFLRSYKYELEKSNKTFIDSLLKKDKPIFKILQFISKEIKELREEKLKELKSLGSLEYVERSIQISLQILEYIDSLIDKIDESDIKRTEIINEQIRKLRISLHDTKKLFLTQSSFFKKIFEDVNSVSNYLNTIEELNLATDIFIDRDVDTLLIEGVCEILNRSKETLIANANKLEELKSFVDSIKTSPFNAIITLMESIERKITENEEKVKLLSERVTYFRETCQAIIIQKNQIYQWKHNLQIFITMTNLFFTQIDIKAITTKESALNYIEYIDRLLSQKPEQDETLKRIEMINEEVIGNFPHIQILDFLFKTETEELIKSLNVTELLEEMKLRLSEKRKVLTEIDNRYKSCIIEMETFKQHIVYNKESLDHSQLQKIENTRHDITMAISYLRDIHKLIDKDQMDKFTMDFEQLETLLDVYEEIVNQERNRKSQQNKVIKFIMDRNEMYRNELKNLHEDIDKTEWSLELCVEDFLNQIGTIISKLFLIRNGIVKEFINVYVHKLMGSDVSQDCQNLFLQVTELLNRHSSMVIEFLLHKCILTCNFDESLSQISSHWILLIQKCLESDNNDDGEYHKKISTIETIKMILECSKTAAQQCHKMVLSSSQLKRIDSFCSNVNGLLSTVNIILEANERLNVKLCGFHLLKSSLTTCAEKLNLHLLLVQSLSDDCSIQKYTYLKNQSQYYKLFLDQHKNLYQLFQKLCDSIVDENLLGFDIEDDINMSMESITTTIDSVNKKHSIALEDIDNCLIEWDKSRNSKIYLDRYFELLEDTLDILKGGNRVDKIAIQMYIERLKLITEYLEENEEHWLLLKIRIGSSSDREYLQQRIKIAESSVLISRMVVAYHSTNTDKRLCQYRELYLDAENLKLDLLHLFSYSISFCLEKDLSNSEKKNLLDQIHTSVLELDKALATWHMRLRHFHPDMIDIYCTIIERKEKYLQNLFKKYFKNFEEIIENYDEYKSIYETIQIRLNVIGEYVEKLENWDFFTKNVLLHYYRYNRADIESCLGLIKTTIDHMSDIQAKLNEIQQLKEKLQQLMFGQNEESNEFDNGKIDDYNAVLDLIRHSQISIRDKLLDIFQPKRTSKVELSFATNEGEYSLADKSIDVSGDVESVTNVVSNERSAIEKTNSNKKLAPLPSITTTASKNINDLEEVYGKVMATLHDQEDFLNAKWKNVSKKVDTIETNHEGVEDNQMEASICVKREDNENIKWKDTHHWFPDTAEASSQTLSDIALPLHISKEGLTNSDLFKTDSYDVKESSKITEPQCLSGDLHEKITLMEDPENGKISLKEFLQENQLDDLSTISDSSENICYRKFSDEKIESKDLEDASDSESVRFQDPIKVYSGKEIKQVEGNFFEENEYQMNLMNKNTGDYRLGNDYQTMMKSNENESFSIKEEYFYDESKNENSKIGKSNENVMDNMKESGQGVPEHLLSDLSLAKSIEINKSTEEQDGNLFKFTENINHCGKGDFEKEVIGPTSDPLIQNNLNNDSVVTCFETEDLLKQSEIRGNLVSQTYIKTYPIYRSETLIMNKTPDKDAVRVIFSSCENAQFDGKTFDKTFAVLSTEKHIEEFKLSNDINTSPIGSSEITETDDIDDKCVIEEEILSFTGNICDQEEKEEFHKSSNIQQNINSENSETVERMNEEMNEETNEDKEDNEIEIILTKVDNKSHGNIQQEEQKINLKNENFSQCQSLSENIKYSNFANETDETDDFESLRSESFNIDDSDQSKIDDLPKHFTSSDGLISKNKSKYKCIDDFVDVLTEERKCENKRNSDDSVETLLEEEWIEEVIRRVSNSSKGIDTHDNVDERKVNKNFSEKIKDEKIHCGASNDDSFLNGIKTNMDNCNVQEIQTNESLIICKTRSGVNECKLNKAEDGVNEKDIPEMFEENRAFYNLVMTDYPRITENQTKNIEEINEEIIVATSSIHNSNNEYFEKSSFNENLKFEIQESFKSPRHYSPEGSEPKITENEDTQMSVKIMEINTEIDIQKKITDTDDSPNSNGDKNESILDRSSQRLENSVDSNSNPNSAYVLETKTPTDMDEGIYEKENSTDDCQPLTAIFTHCLISSSSPSFINIQTKQLKPNEDTLVVRQKQSTDSAHTCELENIVAEEHVKEVELSSHSYNQNEECDGKFNESVNNSSTVNKIECFIEDVRKNESQLNENPIYPMTTDHCQDHYYRIGKTETPENGISLSKYHNNEKRFIPEFDSKVLNSPDEIFAESSEKWKNSFDSFVDENIEKSNSQKSEKVNIDQDDYPISLEHTVQSKVTDETEEGANELSDGNFVEKQYYSISNSTMFSRSNESAQLSKESIDIFVEPGVIGFNQTTNSNLKCDYSVDSEGYSLEDASIMKTNEQNELSDQQDARKTKNYHQVAVEKNDLEFDAHSETVNSAFASDDTTQPSLSDISSTEYFKEVKNVDSNTLNSDYEQKNDEVCVVNAAFSASCDVNFSNSKSDSTADKMKQQLISFPNSNDFPGILQNKHEFCSITTDTKHSDYIPVSERRSSDNYMPSLISGNDEDDGTDIRKHVGENLEYRIYPQSKQIHQTSLSSMNSRHETVSLLDNEIEDKLSVGYELNTEKTNEEEQLDKNVMGFQYESGSFKDSVVFSKDDQLSLEEKEQHSHLKENQDTIEVSQLNRNYLNDRFCIERYLHDNKESSPDNEDMVESPLGVEVLTGSHKDQYKFDDDKYSIKTSIGSQSSHVTESETSNLKLKPSQDAGSAEINKRDTDFTESANLNEIENVPSCTTDSERRFYTQDNDYHNISESLSSVTQKEGSRQNEFETMNKITDEDDFDLECGKIFQEDHLNLFSEKNYDSDMQKERMDCDSYSSQHSSLSDSNGKAYGQHSTRKHGTEFVCLRISDSDSDRALDSQGNQINSREPRKPDINEICVDENISDVSDSVKPSISKTNENQYLLHSINGNDSTSRENFEAQPNNCRDSQEFDEGQNELSIKPNFMVKYGNSPSTDDKDEKDLSDNNNVKDDENKNDNNEDDANKDDDSEDENEDDNVDDNDEDDENENVDDNDEDKDEDDDDNNDNNDDKIDDDVEDEQEDSKLIRENVSDDSIKATKPLISRSTKEKTSESSCLIVFLIALFIAFVILMLLIPLLPIRIHCDNLFYRILQIVNPFRIQTSVPV